LHRRADAGLIITEGTVINAEALECRYVPEVRQNNGLIFLQIWHVGRVSHPDFLGGKLPIGPSAGVMSGAVCSQRHQSRF